MNLKSARYGLMAIGALLTLATAAEAGTVVVVRRVPWYAPPPRVVVYGPPVTRAVYVSQPGGVWYWCETSRGYYPYVRHCAAEWRSVPAVIVDRR